MVLKGMPVRVRASIRPTVLPSGTVVGNPVVKVAVLKSARAGRARDASRLARIKIVLLMLITFFIGLCRIQDSVSSGPYSVLVPKGHRGSPRGTEYCLHGSLSL